MGAKAFDNIDRNRDGVLSLDEFRNAVRIAGGCGDGFVDRVGYGPGISGEESNAAGRMQPADDERPFYTPWSRRVYEAAISMPSASSWNGGYAALPAGLWVPPNEAGLGFPREWSDAWNRRRQCL